MEWSLCVPAVNGLDTHTQARMSNGTDSMMEGGVLRAGAMVEVSMEPMKSCWEMRERPSLTPASSIASSLDSGIAWSKERKERITSELERWHQRDP